MNTVAMLKELGPSVVDAGSGREAIEVLQRQPIDLLITDQGMLKMTSAGLSEEVLSVWPWIPIIVATEQHVPSPTPAGQALQSADLESVIAGTMTASEVTPG